jgi:hypothetical protein
MTRPVPVRPQRRLDLKMDTMSFKTKTF